MLTVFYGDDQIKVRAEAFLYLDKKLKPEQVIEKIEVETFTAGQLTTAAGTAVLFGLPPVFLLDGILREEAAAEELLVVLKELSESAVLFILVEGKLTASYKKALEKVTKEIFEFKAVKENNFNIFDLTECLARKDKKQLWLLLQRAKNQNIRPEEIVGVLWWQLKTLRLVAITKTAEEAGVKDYPYRKAQQALRNFKENEVEDLAFKLLTLYHQSHLGHSNLELALEEWVLTL